jgi:hypothetical protein
MADNFMTIPPDKSVLYELQIEHTGQLGKKSEGRSGLLGWRTGAMRASGSNRRLKGRYQPLVRRGQVNGTLAASVPTLRISS